MWMVRRGVETGARAPHEALDPYQFALPDIAAAEALLSSYGEEECRLRAESLFKARIDNRVQIPATARMLLKYWGWDKITGAYAATYSPRVTPQRTLRVVTRDMLEAQ